MWIEWGGRLILRRRGLERFRESLYDWALDSTLAWSSVRWNLLYIIPLLIM